MNLLDIEMRQRQLLCAILALLFLITLPDQAFAWGKGHGVIRLWAVAHLPQWQLDLVGKDALERLCSDYTSLQDKHAGGNAPELDPYCIVPGVELSLHDVNPPEPSAKAALWYLDRVRELLQSQQVDEAMKFLGVLCHWNEDPGSPGAHSSPINEWQLKALLPPSKQKERFNYLYGAGGIMDSVNYQIADVTYRPRLLGKTREEAALRIYQHQKLLSRKASAHIIPIVQDIIYGDGEKAVDHHAVAALDNARHTADVIYTTLCLAANRFDDDQPMDIQQPLAEWLPEFRGAMIPHPYYVTPFLVNQAMDDHRELHPLAIGNDPAKITTGYGMGTPFSLDFVLAPGRVFNRFSCRVGLHRTAGPRGAVTFAVVANGTPLVRTRPVKAGQPAVMIQVALPAAESLELSLQTIAEEGSEPSHNLAVWADPVLSQSE